MKKSVRFLAFAVIAGSIFSMTACGEEEVVQQPEHKHTYATEWSKDATMHWHAGTCEHTDEMKDVSGHVDENKDGTCDVCLYDGGHVHTYKDTYSYDALNHWYDSDCYHAVKDGVEAHVADSLGYCKCGYKVGDPDLTTVGKAVALGVSQESLVNGGTVTKTTVDGNGTRTENGSFDIGDDYFHQLNYYNNRGSWSVEEYWYGKVNGNVIPFERQGNDVIFHNYDIENEVVNGWFFDGNENGNNTGKCYGVADYVESLYEVATVDAMDGTLVESVVDGVYSFQFDVYHSDSSNNISSIAVDFTLGETYFIETVNVTAEQWYYAVDSDGDGVYEKPAGAPDSKVEYVIAQRTGDAVVKAFDPAEKVLSNFDLYSGDEKVEDTITLTAGTQASFGMKDLAPESATDLAYEKFTVEGKNVDTQESITIGMLSGNYMVGVLKGSKKVNFNFKVAGTYEVTVSSLAFSKTYTVVVDYADVTSINTTVNGVNATTGATFVDETFTFGTAVNAYAENLATAEFVSVPEDSTLIPEDIRYNESTGMFLFMPDVAGEYVIKVTAKNNATVSATLTVTVSEKPSVGSLFNGTWAGTTTFLGLGVEAVFTPDATPVDGAQFSGSVVVTVDENNDGVAGGTYKYVYSNNEFKLYEADGTTAVSGYKFWVELNADMTMHAVYNTFDKGALVQQASSGGDEPVVGENTLANTTWSATTSFISAVVTAEFGEDTVVVTSSVKDTPGGTYSYTYDGTTFAIYEEGTTTAVSGYKWWVKVEGGVVYAIYNEQDKGALVKQEGTTGGDEGGEDVFEGTGADNDPYVITEVPVDFDVKCDNKVWYKYTATANASLTITADSNDYWAQVTASNVSGDYAASDENCEPLTFNVEEGVTYTIMLFTWSEVPGEYGVSITVGEYTGDEGGEDPVLPPEPQPSYVELGEGDNEIVVTADDITNEVIAAEFMVWVTATYTFTFDEDTMFAIVYNYDDFTMEIGRGIVYLEEFTRYSIRIYVGGVEVADTYNLTISYEAPAQLELGENEITVTDDDITAEAMEFVFNSADAGDYEFTANDENIQFQIWKDGVLYMRGGQAALEAYSEYTIVVIVVNATAGEYTISIAYNAPAGSYDNPEAIEELPTTVSFTLSNPGYELHFYELTLTEATDIVITFANTDSWVQIDGESEQIAYEYSQTEYNYSLQAGTYLIGLGTWDGTPVETVSVTIAVKSADEGGEEGGDATLTDVKTWVGANGSGRAMKVTIDYDNKIVKITRATMSGNKLEVSDGAIEATYNYTFDGTDYSFEFVSISSPDTNNKVITLDATGTPVSVVWGSATYTDFVLQA